MSVRDQLRRIALHRAHYANGRRRFEILYWLGDPWKMSSEAEASRFQWTNRLIEGHLGPLGTLLEVGCGEGHQSLHLIKQCDQLFGIDVSRSAIARCRARCPQGQFVVGSHVEFAFPSTPAVFDLVVACEVIYYLRDVTAAIAQLSALGRACLITYYDARAPELDPIFADVAEGTDVHRHGQTTWKAVWWRNHRANAADGGAR